MTEDQIIEGCRRGDREGQKALYALTSDRVYRLLLRITRNADDAFDLSQDTFLRAFERIGQFDGHSALTTWVCQIAVNEALQLLRRQKNREVGLRKHGSKFKTELQMDDPDARLDVQDAVDRLSDNERALVVLRYFEGLDYAEISQILGKSMGSIASGLNRARQSLRDLLERKSPAPEENTSREHRT